MENLRELLVALDFFRSDTQRMIGNTLEPVWADKEQLAAVACKIPAWLARDVTLWIFAQYALLPGRLHLLRHLLDPHCVVPSEMKGYYWVHGELVHCSPELMREFRETLKI